MIMLQLSATFCTATARFAPRSSWRLTALIASSCSTAVVKEHSVASVKEDDGAKLSKIQNNVLQKEEKQKSKKTEAQTKLSSPGKRFSKNNDIFLKQFQAATSINDLLNLATLPNLSTNNALKIISNITNQINSGKSLIADIETDERFIHLRKMVKTDDLSQYTQLSTPAMIQVIMSLREQGNRNTPLLRMLSYNIVKYNMTLNLKQCAILLYCMATLNFPDKVLLEKITSDLLECLPKSTNATTNRYVTTSLGLLRYKNENVLDAICDTLFANSINYKFKDYSSILQTFAALQYKSERANLFIEKFAEEANRFQTSSIEWLDIVWSLAVLDAAKSQHVESVLEPAFVKTLSISSKLNVSKKLKLLNINAVAQFVLKNYTGPLLNKNSEEFNNISLVRAKEKQMYIDALSETLKELFSSQSYFKTNIDTNMGFLLDAEYRINNQHKPVQTENWTDEQSNVKRIAIMVHDYHDYCRGQTDLVGSRYLYTQLLKARGYDLVTISYENFSIQDKVNKRIDYLKQRLNDAQKMRSIE